jgi:hypothetical protein
MRLRAADLGKRFPGLLDAILGAAVQAGSPQTPPPHRPDATSSSS